MKNKNVLVVGLAKSGVAAARLLRKQGAHVTVADEKPRRELSSVLRELPKGVSAKVGSSKFFSPAYDLIVISPGVPWDHPDLVKARKHGIPVWPELELGWRNCRPNETVAITGTNGKTTTTALIAHILKTARRSVVVGGNIGTPLSALTEKISTQTSLVLEVSSYQLEAHRTFHPNVGVFLNLTPDHLKRHGTMEGYAAAKARLFALMTPNDTAVLNGKDKWCRSVARDIYAKKVFFPNWTDQELAKSIRLPGAHNMENAMAAAGACRALGVSASDIRRGLASFKGVPHRIEIVRELDGVRYVNDSKATNVDSTMVALKSFKGRIRLILGGEHKGSPYTPLKPLIKRRVIEILTIGEAAPIIAKDLKGAAPIVACETLAHAVRSAHQHARRGDVVLLSPACASFDQFKNFEHRGHEFVRLVTQLS